MRSIENAANNEDAKLNCSRLLPPDNRLSLSFNLDDIGNVNQAEYPLAGQYDDGGGGGDNNNGLFNGTSMFQNTSDGGDLTNQPNASSFAQLTKEALSMFDSFTTTHTNELSDSASTETNSTGRKYCIANWDGASCWMPTLAGTEAVIPCFSSFNGITYDSTQNATRLCLSNGEWAEISNYNRCIPTVRSFEEQMASIEEHYYETSIFYVGYSLSLCGLLIALFIFFHFKELRCLRNAIHTNLMVTYVLIAVIWIITDRAHADSSDFSRNAACFLVIALRYLMATNFFWMFVEGFMLYMVIYNTFQCKQIALWHVNLIGWGIPAIFVVPWVIFKYLFSKPVIQDECPLQVVDEFDYIYKVPILTVLVINIFFLGVIMWILVIKLQPITAMQWHTMAESKQYRKAARALLVLIPLLGIGYMLVLVTPSHPFWKMLFKNAQATLVSTQGLLVAILYCFFNGEVQNCIRHHYTRYKLNRTLRGGGDYPESHKKRGYYISDAKLVREANGHLLCNSKKAKKKSKTERKTTVKRKMNDSEIIRMLPNDSRTTPTTTTTTTRCSDVENNGSDSFAIRMFRNVRICSNDKGRDDSLVSNFTTASTFVPTTGGGGGVNNRTNGTVSVNAANILAHNEEHGLVTATKMVSNDMIEMRETLNNAVNDQFRSSSTNNQRLNQNDQGIGMELQPI